MSDQLLSTLLDEFRRRHEAGERPDPLELLERAGAAAEQLAEVLDLYLADHPAPDPAPAALDRLAADERFAPPAWSTLLVAARQDRRLLRRTAVERLTRALGFGASAEARVGEHLHGLEAGLLEPASVSDRVIDALDAVYAGLGPVLRRTRLVGLASAPSPSPAFRRADRSDDATEPAPASVPREAPADTGPEQAEVDRLFLGS